MEERSTAGSGAADRSSLPRQQSANVIDVGTRPRGRMAGPPGQTGSGPAVGPAAAWSTVNAPWASRTRLVAAGLLAVVALAVGPLIAVMTPIPATAAEPTPSPAVDGAPWWHRGEDGSPVVDLYFGYSSTCPHCQEAMPWVRQLETELPWLEVHRLQLDGGHDENVAVINELAATIGQEVRYVPAFLFGARLETGFDTPATSGPALRTEIEAYHREVVLSSGTGPAASPGPTGSGVPASGSAPVSLPLVGRVDAASVSLPVLAIVLGGLDAFNPCALSVLLFLLSVLVATRSRTRMAAVGLTFVAVSGIVYFVLMAAWLNVFLIAGELRLVTLAAGAAAVIAALINIKDFVWFRRGVSLVIPESARPAIFGRMLDIGEATTFRAILVATVLVAAAANAYEMLCTGGFPVVFTRALTLHALPTPTYYGYLVLYNVVYVAPLALIVVGFTATLGSRGVSVVEARRLKLLSGLLMLALGFELLVSPDRLTDLATSILVFGVAITTWVVVVLADRRRGPGGPGPLEAAREAGH